MTASLRNQVCCHFLFPAGQFKIKAVIAAVTFCPDLPVMLLCDTLRDGKSETVAVVHGSCLIDPIKAFENVFKVFFADRLALIRYLQQTVLMSAQ